MKLDERPKEVVVRLQITGSNDPAVAMAVEGSATVDLEAPLGTRVVRTEEGTPVEVHRRSQ
ncbi:hypothetical protein [Actinomadura craniellae]|uniref:hypothetical protein n=1 Tax=Actinomadura craniellae TaxID=2231787 RepID=UPI0011BE57CE|nr:hypothetical protein [Actinomadura craniellae]